MRLVSPQFRQAQRPTYATPKPTKAQATHTYAVAEPVEAPPTQ